MCACSYICQRLDGWDKSTESQNKCTDEDLGCSDDARGLLRKMMCSSLLRSLQSAQPQSQWVSDSAIHSVQWQTVAACCMETGRGTI